MSTMRAEFMMVDPNELIVDMVVDDDHVKELMETMRSNGMIQPVTIWLQGLRIIDGFHRVEAAKRLGWTEIQCVVRDCSDDSFWDARIISAKQHHKISEKRLAAWITESWKLTEWYRPVDISQLTEDYEKFGVSLSQPVSEDALDSFSVAQEIWDLDFGTVGILGFPIRKNENLSPMARWFSEKAEAWGSKEVDIRHMLLECLGYERNRFRSNQERSMIDELTKKKSLSLAEKSAIEMQISKVKWANYEEEKGIVSEWIDSSRSSRAGVLLSKYRKEEEDKRREETLARIKLDNERQRQRDETPSGKAEIKRQRLTRVREDFVMVIEAMKKELRYVEDTMPEIPDSPALLNDFISFVESRISSVFPSFNLNTKANPILSENVILRKKIKEMDEKISSLERALAAKSKVSTSVVSLSSADIDRMN